MDSDVGDWMIRSVEMRSVSCGEGGLILRLAKTRKIGYTYNQ